MDEQDEATLHLHEEKLVVDRRPVLTGRVRVRTETETVETLTEALLEADAVEVTRRPIGRRVTEPPQIRTEGDLTIVPVIEEVLVMEKHLFLKEEIHIRRTRRQDRVEIPATVRRQTAVIEREAVTDPTERHHPRDDATAIPARIQPMTDLNQSYGASGAQSTVSAFFDHRPEAEAAIARLTERGIPDSAIRLTEGAADGQVASPEPRGFFESLADFFMPNEDRHTYAEGLARGGYLVVVTGLGSGEYEMALDILDDEGAVDLDTRADTWRAEGWTGHDSTGHASTGTPPYAASGALGGAATAAATGTEFGTGEDRLRDTEIGDDESIPIVEERLTVGKRDVSHGRVRVRSYVVEEPVSEEVELSQDRVHIERRPVDRALGSADDAFRERVIEAEEHAEEAVVSKEARVVEEIGLRREHDSHRETVSDTIRRTEVEIEDDRDAAPTRTFERDPVR